MSIAHYFTLSRVLLSPFFPIIYLGYSWFGIPLQWLPYILLFLLVLYEFSDVIDGHLARKKNQVTDLGKIIDPMADSVTRITIFFTFTKDPVSIPLLIVFIFLYREFFISTLRILCALKGVALAARTSGKIKAIIQALVSFVIVILMIPYILGYLSESLYQQLCTLAVGLSAAYTIVSAIDYVSANRNFIKNIL